MIKEPKNKTCKNCVPISYILYLYVPYNYAAMKLNLSALYTHDITCLGKKFVSLFFASHGIKEHQSLERYWTSYVLKAKTSRYSIFITISYSIISRWLAVSSSRGLQASSKGNGRYNFLMCGAIKKRERKRDGGWISTSATLIELRVTKSSPRHRLNSPG